MPKKKEVPKDPPNWFDTYADYALKWCISKSAICERINKKLSSRHRIPRQIVDSILGIVLCYVLMVYNLFTPKLISELISVLSAMLVSIKELIDWISLHPAGLKLNYPLNNVLSKFFLYHIYLWQTYISVVSAWLGPALLAASSVLGLSMLLATVSDVISLLTIHMLCFHVYSTRLASLLYYSVASLWRVFRGRKYNPLRDRVDSVELDSRQLFIATLFLTALIFLTPTVLVYFVVFSTLRFAVMGTKELLELLGSLVDEILIRFFNWCSPVVVLHPFRMFSSEFPTRGEFFADDHWFDNTVRNAAPELAHSRRAAMDEFNKFFPDDFMNATREEFFNPEIWARYLDRPNQNTGGRHAAPPSAPGSASPRGASSERRGRRAAPPSAPRSAPPRGASSERRGRRAPASAPPRGASSERRGRRAPPSGAGPAPPRRASADDGVHPLDYYFTHENFGRYFDSTPRNGR